MDETTVHQKKKKNPEKHKEDIGWTSKIEKKGEEETKVKKKEKYPRDAKK